MPQEFYHEVGEIGPTVEEQIEFLDVQLQKKEQISFMDLMKRLKNRITVIVTFMAILEMIRTRRIMVRQNEIFGDIWIMTRTS